MMTLRYRDDVMNNVWNNFFNGDRVERFTPVYDVIETEKEYNLVFELPGIGEDLIGIEVKDNILNLEVKNPEKSEDEKELQYLVKNRKEKVFTKGFKLPADADSEGIDAKMKDGLLTLTINKREEMKPKKITINI